MKRFVLIQKSGEGCDYSIGCGLAWEIVEAEDRATAVEKLLHIAVHGEDGGWFNEYQENEIFNAWLFEVPYGVPEAMLPVSDWRDLWLNLRAADTDAERAEYERLKKKFGDG